MKLCASNLALPAFDHRHLLPRLRAMGLQGIEIVPSHTWADPWRDVNAAQVDEWRHAAQRAGLTVTGLHGLLWGQHSMGLFTDFFNRKATLDYLLYLSAICRDLGGHTLVLDSRWRQDLPDRAAWQQCRLFLEELLPRMEAHGTVLCFAPIGASQGDFCASAKECYLMVNAIDHPAFGLHLSSAGLAATGEMGHVTFAAVRGRLDHFHADEPDFAAPGSDSTIDHVDLRRHLAAISYFGWVSVVQRHAGTGDGLAELAQGVDFVTRRYLPIDTR
ncbi:sugar phosphate isomerase/epimerase family protein [Magnetospirillum sulfuroxidans]|uniref:Sugar phosphate isomerase/epimerase n=1 Tax=Magnetospirillum sulfuroxidans TaxID=611300 RepID=A0ABS5IIB1_9PROT|nr:sugar phosphate isomerase/epimerase [Magnetospirillum sulfuroxidans]MBR9973443.1 sugar phosphate isomerase/epimerase [Magnetospirillum sulfuroxidans]